jgi:predicted anti-sigma-YlaC factor YlaD
MTFVDCLTCREALSARMDGEAEPAPAEQTDQHLATCAACRSWQARAARTSRMLRVRQAAPVPDLSAAILDMAVPPQSPRGWWARIALIVVAVAQLGLALTQILGAGSPADHGGQHVPLPAAEHLFNESTAWNLAVGIGLLWAAFRSRVTSGLIPVLGGFVLLLGVYSVQGLAAGTVAATRVAEHGLLLVGLGLLIVINRWYADPDPRSGTALDEGGTTINATESDPAGETPEPTGTTDRPPLRPAGRHRAA